MFSGTVCIKRFALVLAALLIAISTAAAQGFEFEVSNELSSDIVHIRDEEHGGTTFAGIENEFIIDLTSDRFDVGVDLIFGFYDEPYRFAFDEADWYAAFRPIGFLEFALSKDYEFAGSYMYVEDDNVGGAKMGSNGFTIAFVGGGVTPLLDGLTVTFTMPFDNLGDWTDGESGANYFDSFQFGFGAEYNFRDIFSIGAAVKSWVQTQYDGGYNGRDNRTVSFSVSAGIFPVSGLSIYVGYSYQDYEGLMDVYGKNLLNFSLSYEARRFAVGLDFLTNFKSHYHDNYPGVYYDDHSDYDLYFAAYGEFSLSRLFLIKLTLADQFRFEEEERGIESENLFIVSPGVEFQTGIGDFSIEVEVGIDNAGFEHLGFPVSWTYEF